MEKIPDPLESFKDEIAALKAEEEAGRDRFKAAQARDEEARSTTSGHFLRSEFDEEEFAPGALIEADRAIWEKVKQGVVRREDLLEYQQGIKEAGHSRRVFAQFIMNKAMSAIHMRELRAREELENSLDQKERTGDFPSTD